MAAQRVGQVAIAAAVAIALGAVGNADGLIFAQVAGFFSIGLACLWRMRVIFSRLGSVELGRVARENASAPAFLLPSALLDVASMQLPVMLIMMWFGTFDAGQFSMAWRILSLPMAVVGAAVGQVFFQRFAQLKGDPRAARALLFRTWKSLFLFGALPTCALMLIGPWLFSIALGGAWREAGSLAAVLSPMVLALLVVGPTSSAMVALGLNKQMMMFGLVSFLYRPLCLWVGFEFGSLRLGIFLYVVTEIVQVVTYMVFILIGLRR
jgi:O-antigen/teichoic acid export membrane protein